MRFLYFNVACVYTDGAINSLSVLIGKRTINMEVYMKHIIATALIAGAAATAQGQTQAPTQAPSPWTSDAETTVQIPAPQYTIDLPTRRHFLASHEFDTYRGIYSLSNGDEMRLRQRGNRIYAMIGESPERELVAAATNIFVAKDRSLKMTLFADELNDRITGEVLIRKMPSVADATSRNSGEVVRLVAGH